MKVPLLDLKAHYDSIRTEILAAIGNVIDSQSFILGPQVQKFEQRVAEYCSARHAIGVSSGTDALLVSLMALGIGPGDEVITTAYSFFATAGCIARLGATPVFVDIDPVTCNIDARQIPGAMTDRTRAILPVHLYGQCADMEPILALANAHDVPVVEDAAQAIGARYRDGRQAGAMATFGCLSFFPSKNLGGLGDGGMVLTSDEELAEKVRVLRVHGSKPKYYHGLVGGNFRLDTLHAAALDCMLDHLNNWTGQRRVNARRYQALFAEQCSRLTADCSLVLPEAVYEDSDADAPHVYNQYVIRTSNRDALQDHLKERQIGTAIYYPVPFHLQKCFAALGHRTGDFPEAERAAAQTMAIPVYPELTEEQQNYVVDSIAEFFVGSAQAP